MEESFHEALDIIEAFESYSKKADNNGKLLEGVHFGLCLLVLLSTCLFISYTTLSVVKSYRVSISAV
ncbi:hypothetical protein [Mucilaginibacter agri]|uniref:Transmembrane protein n=1 Tax=Mucilaginibacter agri TaxID=2695265 RepID=A0A965ZK61_9SPHI|nr:hypothetical protein [Mucilaginibacter agri]NCD71532.1 hypothetical protein [Mucilaginibacter agri]